MVISLDAAREIVEWVALFPTRPKWQTPLGQVSLQPSLELM